MLKLKKKLAEIDCYLRSINSRLDTIGNLPRKNILGTNLKSFGELGDLNDHIKENFQFERESERRIQETLDLILDHLNLEVDVSEAKPAKKYLKKKS